jgi:hypothetical protein
LQGFRTESSRLKNAGFARIPIAEPCLGGTPCALMQPLDDKRLCQSFCPATSRLATIAHSSCAEEIVMSINARRLTIAILIFVFAPMHANAQAAATDTSLLKC